ncbi:sigma factor-like helix-turn-helix DNA-binding protein [Streptomyces sp. NPDC048389]|uniref:sigma factor-like helix-turn-helix DNA-binding protein n=1 Tax=Streptomyces sp. NPDC048389 TaxID=3154622 RepID=UPI00345174EB
MTKSTTRSASGVPLPPPKERRRLRETASVSEGAVAAAAGVTRGTVRSWETGRTDPRGRKREAYAKLLASFAAAARDATTSFVAAQDAPAPFVAAQDGPTPFAAARNAPAPFAAAQDAPAPFVAAQDGPTPGSPGPGPQDPAPPESRTGPASTPAPAAPGPAPVTVAAPGAVGIPVAVPVVPPRPGPGPEEAFDALYAATAPGLVGQTYLLGGRRRLALESVEHAFHLAWQRWPEVAVDRDPAGWVRAVAHEYAMSPWNRLRAVHRYPDVLPEGDPLGTLLDALQELPPAYRRTLLLHDGLGLGLPETAAETEASTRAAANRLLHAREALAERLPGPAAGPGMLRDRLRVLVDAVPEPLLTPASAVRGGGERRARTWTRTVATATALMAAATVFTMATAPRQYEPPVSATRQVDGVPAPRYGPHALTAEERSLRDKLRAGPGAGPERLVPMPG